MAAPFPLRHRRFTIDEYHQMAEAGILHEDEPIELIRGEIVEMSAVGFRHIWCVRRTSRSCHRLLGDSVYIDVQSPIQLLGDGEPEPDIVLVRPTQAEGTPVLAEDVLLVIEVADSSLAYDRSVKLPLYAEAGIPEAWLFNLLANRIERHTDPGPDGYRTVAYADAGQRIGSTVLPNLIFDVAELFGLNRARPR